MIDVNTFLLMMLYMLGSILLIVLIVLGIKLIFTVNKINAVVDDVGGKVGKLNGLFQIIDTTTDKLASISDKVTDGLSFIIKKIFIKEKNEKKEDDENE